MNQTERLYDCQITYHLNGGQVINESFRQDIPHEVWQSVRQEFSDFNLFIDILPSDTFANVLLPKSNISYITMKVLSSMC